MAKVTDVLRHVSEEWEKKKVFEEIRRRLLSCVSAVIVVFHGFFVNRDPLHEHSLIFKLPNFPTKNQPLLFTLNSSSSFSTTTTPRCVATPSPPPHSDPVSITNVASDRTRDRHKIVRVPWEKLIRWSHSWRSKAKTDIPERTRKVVVLGGGSFGTAMTAHVANKKNQLEVYMLVRDPLVCQSINETHCNCRYFPEHKLPDNVIATTDAKSALLGADYCLLAVPVQGIADYVDPGLPFISLSKGLELNTLRMMSQIIPRALKNPRQPFIALSGPSFALELMNKLPIAMVVASKDKKLANAVQQLLASSHLRISTSR